MKKTMFVLAIAISISFSLPAFAVEPTVTHNGDNYKISIPVADAQAYAQRKGCWVSTVKFYASVNGFTPVDGAVQGDYIVVEVPDMTGQKFAFTALICESGINSAWYSEQYSYDVHNGLKETPAGWVYVPHKQTIVGGNYVISGL